MPATAFYGLVLNKQDVIEKLKYKSLISENYKIIVVKHPNKTEEHDESEEDVKMEVIEKDIFEDDEDQYADPLEKEEAALAKENKKKEEEKMLKERKRKRMTMAERYDIDKGKAVERKKKYKYIEEPKIIKACEVDSETCYQENLGNKVKVRDMTSEDYDDHVKTLKDVENLQMLQELSWSNLKLETIFVDGEESDLCRLILKSSVIKIKMGEDMIHTLSTRMGETEVDLFLAYLKFDCKPDWHLLVNKG